MIRVTTVNTESVVRRMKLYRKKLSTFNELWAAIASEVAKGQEEWFESEGGLLSTRWRPLSPAYAAHKELVYPGAPILVATGRLKQSLVDPLQLRKRSTKTTLVLGTDVEYAKFHHEGTENMPKRDPLMPISLQRKIVKATAAKFAHYEKTGVTVVR